MRHVCTALLAIAIPDAAVANEKPAAGPIPAWVKRIDMPPAGVADDRPVRLLLSDQQTRFERDGSVSRFARSALHIQKAEGLAAGTVAFAWRPDLDDVTVHELKLIRGVRTLDALASGKSFTILRRETDLEAAKLNGVLTATMQLDGVEIGDIVLLSMSMRTRDPVLTGHPEELGGAWNGLSIARANLRVEWPAEENVRHRIEGGLPAARPFSAGGFNGVELTADKLEPQLAPKFAPPRFRRGRMVEVSAYRSWKDISGLLGPLYAKAARIPSSGALRDELEKIKAASRDPVKRTEAALALVQGRVRYVALQMGAGGLVPASAENTWSSRYGDCKGKTALLLALLTELGIQAEPVAVSIDDGDGMDARLPRVGLFDHVLVHAIVNGQTHWLEGTRTGDGSLAQMAVPNFIWGLPLTPSSDRLVPIRPKVPSDVTEERSLRIDARNGVYAPANTHAQIIYRGDAAKLMNAALNALGETQRTEALRQFWKERLDEVAPDKVSSFYDPVSGSAQLNLEGTAHLDWDGSFWRVPWSKVGYKADFSRPEGPNRDAPYHVGQPWSLRIATSIKLPAGITQYAEGNLLTVDEKLAGVAYRRSSSVKEGEFRMELSEAALQIEIPYQQAMAAQASLRRLDKSDVYLKLNGYEATEADLTVKAATNPDDVNGLIDRGVTYLQAGKYDLALADFNKAHELDAKDPWPLANRGLSYVWKRDAAKAKADFDAALALDPKNPVVFRGLALLHVQDGKPREAIKALNQSLVEDPNDSFALMTRAQTYWEIGEPEKALADTDAVIRLGAPHHSVRLLRANIFRLSGKRELALEEARLLANSSAEGTEALVTAGMIMAAYGQRDEALRVLGRAIAKKPEAYIYLNRYRVRDKRDTVSREADLKEALGLDPELEEAHQLHADFLAERGQHSGAVLALTRAIDLQPLNVRSWVQRGISRVRAGEPVLGAADMAKARDLAKTPTDFNTICWAKATSGQDLAGALEDCGKALELAPDRPAYLDSRALVLARLGRHDEALADYDKALAKAPRQASSLYGRALTHARKGNREQARADRAKALSENPDVEREYASYGLQMQ